MFTQCPECSVAFRVTAEVLRKAAGRVRCGGCGNAFNALEYLSEFRPPPRRNVEPDPVVPELSPEVPDDAEFEPPPRAISAEQSAALLKTLDQLAGEDIRIEDTGVEWRVIDEFEDEAGGDVTGQPDAGESGSLRFELRDAAGPSVADNDAVAEIGTDGLEESAEPDEELRFDDNTPLPDDFDFESAHHPVRRTPTAASAPPSEQPASQVPLDLGNPDDWLDLLGEFDDDTPAAVDGADANSGAGRELPPDTDIQFALRAEEFGIDSGSRNIDDEEGAMTSIDEDLIAAAFEVEAAARAAARTAKHEADGDTEFALAADAEEDDEAGSEDTPSETAFDEFADPLIDAWAMEDPALFDDSAEETESAQDFVEDLALIGDETQPVIEHYVPEMSEEEKTINLLIDQDLLAIAVEDEDGFASTIVQKQASRDEDIPREKRSRNTRQSSNAAPTLVETIIMEGEFVRGELDRERLAAEAKAKREAQATLSRKHDGRDQKGVPPSRRAGMAAGCAALALLLGIQALHQSREALATVPALNRAIAPFYRVLGNPVTPEWDVGGWRFEATKGSTDDAESLLTIYSRIGNNSDGPLPYPMIHVSLTDRFEEVIGSRVMEPSQYLVGNADPRQAVPPGSNFDAVISIESPAPEATGFKLNVCYRLAAGQLRCAIEDFK